MTDRMDEDVQQPADSVAGGDADLASQLEAARAEAAMYKDKYLREYADKENFRKAQERRTLERLRSEKREALTRILDVLDNVDRAIVHEESLDLNGMRQSLRMVQWQLGELLKSEGLTAVPAVGEPFDPRVHEAVELVESPGQPEGQVVEEIRKGYKLGDETLRPARVKVSAAAQR
jgi:molecular chaperone GrpE